ncbi:MAG: hypothetical protein WC365_01265 [Candidatus Babeliales bacterium]
MSKLFIMTVRNYFVDRQMKLTVENGRCFIREYRLYPRQDIMTSEKVVTQKKFIKTIVANMAANLDASSVADVYFNGYNYKQFMNKGNCLE